MSTRQLRKIQKQNELLQLQEAAGVTPDISDEEEPEVPISKPRASLFAALGQNDDDADAENDGDDVGSDGGAEKEGDALPVSVASGKKSKKKKKKNKKKTQAVTELPDAADKEDDIDRVLKELNISTTTTAKVAPVQATTRRDASLLRISPALLKPGREMRALFGRDTIDTAHQEDAAALAARRRRPGATMDMDMETFLKSDVGKKQPDVLLRRNIFVEGRDYWPAGSAGGLSMKDIDNMPDGSTEYAFVFDKNYDAAQTAFFQEVEIGDPVRMIHLLKAVRKSRCLPWTFPVGCTDI
jgi:hypothetical protein